VYVACTWCVYVQCVCGVRVVCVWCSTRSAGMYVFTFLRKFWVCGVCVWACAWCAWCVCMQCVCNVYVVWYLQHRHVCIPFSPQIECVCAVDVVCLYAVSTWRACRGCVVCVCVWCMSVVYVVCVYCVWWGTRSAGMYVFTFLQKF